MNTTAKYLLGIATALPLVGIVVVFVQMAGFFRAMAAAPPYSSDPPAEFWNMMITSGIFSVFSLALTVFYAIHTSNNKRLADQMRIAWILICVFGGFVGQLIYFFLHIFPHSPEQNTHHA